MTLFAVRQQEIGVDEVLGHVRHAGAGGVVVFVGMVRDNNEGQATTLLEYEAYVSMAEKEMASIAQEIAAEISGTRLAALHRIGRLNVGDIAVVCAASAPHRAEAFRAARELIDRVKQRVPIWKREHGPQGAHWVNWDVDDAVKDPTAR
jgi:molybdopterin synthase catalytic subunit